MFLQQRSQDLYQSQRPQHKMCKLFSYSFTIILAWLETMHEDIYAYKNVKKK